MIDLDDVENLTSADGPPDRAKKVIELSDSDSEEASSGDKRGKEKKRREKKGNDDKVTSHA